MGPVGRTRSCWEPPSETPSSRHSAWNDCPSQLTSIPSSATMRVGPTSRPRAVRRMRLAVLPSNTWRIGSPTSNVPSRRGRTFGVRLESVEVEHCPMRSQCASSLQSLSSRHSATHSPREQNVPHGQSSVAPQRERAAMRASSLTHATSPAGPASGPGGGVPQPPHPESQTGKRPNRTAYLIDCIMRYSWMTITLQENKIVRKC